MTVKQRIQEIKEYERHLEDCDQCCGQCGEFVKNGAQLMQRLWDLLDRLHGAALHHCSDNCQGRDWKAIKDIEAAMGMFTGPRRKD